MKSPYTGWVVGVAFVCLFVGESLADNFDSIESTENEISEEGNNQYGNTYQKPGKARSPQKYYEKENKGSGRRKGALSYPPRPPRTTPAPTTTTTTAEPSTRTSPPSSGPYFALPNFGMVQGGSSQSLSVSVKKSRNYGHLRVFLSAQSRIHQKPAVTHVQEASGPFGRHFVTIWQGQAGPGRTDLQRSHLRAWKRRMRRQQDPDVRGSGGQGDPASHRGCCMHVQLQSPQPGCQEMREGKRR
uniref:Putative gamma-interferon inducible lysosomal thiol reductase n=1 Tax=Ixodes ricinus TaxID=34613 RepID=A0A147BHR6_IXORI